MSAAIPPAVPPRLSIIVPAWNEADWLPETLVHLQAACAGLTCTWELLVVDNASDDETAALAATAGARVVHEAEQGIARARNTGAAAAAGQWLLFVDADTRPPVALLARTEAALADGALCGGGAVLDFDGLGTPIYRLGTRLWNRLSRAAGLAAGCYLFVTREAFEAVGGFNAQLYAGEEVFLSRRLRRWARAHGQRFEVLDGPPVLTSGRKAEWFSPWQHAVVMLTLLLFPLALRSRRLSWFWYRRPK
ncbi:MAG: glycosyltransferase [Gammaproteobacteria bacterium]|nr:MAG: glycosyltransferase [Gammaproteobacteria bacterium]